MDFFVRVLADMPRLRRVAFSALHGGMPQKRRARVYASFCAASGGSHVLACTDVAARGIDIPDVDWIIQFDPPQDPNFFVHRVGRTARAGRRGRALLFLAPGPEEAYIDFLAGRRVPITAVAPATLVHKGGTADTAGTHDGAGRALGASDSSSGAPQGAVVPQAAAAAAASGGAPNVLPLVRRMVYADRDVLEKGTRAFISFLRSYKEHQCNFIFRFEALDLAAVARAFVIQRLPKMTELTSAKLYQVYEQASEAEVRAIKFKDKQREKQRVAKIEKRLAEQALEWKNSEEHKHRAQEKKRKQKQQLEHQNQDNQRRKRKGRNQQITEEWDELAREERLFKRFKQGKISKKQYESELSELDNLLIACVDQDGKVTGGHKKKKKKQTTVRCAGRARARVCVVDTYIRPYLW